MSKGPVYGIKRNLPRRRSDSDSDGGRYAVQLAVLETFRVSPERRADVIEAVALPAMTRPAAPLPRADQPIYAVGIERLLPYRLSVQQQVAADDARHAQDQEPPGTLAAYGDEVRGYFLLPELLGVVAVSEPLMHALLPDVSEARQAAAEAQSTPNIVVSLWAVPQPHHRR